MPTTLAAVALAFTISGGTFALADPQSGDDPAAQSPAVPAAEPIPSDPPAIPGGDGSEGDGFSGAPEESPFEEPESGGTGGEGEEGSDQLGSGDGAQSKELPESGDEGEGVGGIVPFALPPTPYLIWTVKDTQENYVGGATFTLQGPRSGNSWGSSYTVADCTADPCTGYDRDSTPGVIAVSYLGTSQVPVSTSSRYRVQRTGANVSGYTWISGTGQRDIPGVTNNSSTPAAGAWQGGVYDFGTFYLRSNDAPATQPSCSAGFVYSVSGTGQLRQIAPDGTVTNVGTQASGVSYFNGLGIGLGGDKVFGFERTTNLGYNVSATIWEYNVSTGTWSSTGKTQATNTNLVAGAVCLYCGNYFFGGFNDGGTRFYVWMYNWTTGTITPKGYVNTSSGAGPTNNGDLAFDRLGNMYVVRGAGSTITVYTVVHADLAAAGANTELTASSTTPAAGVMNNVNGAALDSSGRLFLGDASTVRAYDMPSMTNGVTVTTGLTASTDLGSCAMPATIVLEKELPNGRANPGDQFRLDLKQDGNLVGTATTTGSAVGVQNQRVGPLPTVRAITLDFEEAFLGGANPAHYRTTWKCNVDGDLTPYASGTGTSGSIEVPASGDEIVCRFVNSPLVANVNIHKQVLDEDGENPAPGSGWTVGAVATGDATATPAATTQATNASGVASWLLTYPNPDGLAAVQVSEVQQSEHEFVSGECVVTNINGTPGTPVAIADETGVLVEGIQPGERVDCTFVNQRLGHTLQLTKEVENSYGGTGVPEDFTLVATPAASGSTPLEFESGEVKSVQTGEYAIGEVAVPGYEQVSVICQQDEGTEFELAAGEALEIGEEDLVTSCVIKNRDLPGSLTWTKIAAGTEEPLHGSEWKLVGPAPATTEVAITDCIIEGSGTCAGPDLDPEGGAFLLEGLSWGTYQLIETRAPAGYALNPTPRPVVIGPAAPASLEVNLDPIENEILPGPDLPLTGGLSTEAFLLGGGIATVLGAAIATFIQRRRATNRNQ